MYYYFFSLEIYLKIRWFKYFLFKKNKEWRIEVFCSNYKRCKSINFFINGRVEY